MEAIFDILKVLGIRMHAKENRLEMLVRSEDHPELILSFPADQIGQALGAINKEVSKSGAFVGKELIATGATLTLDGTGAISIMFTNATGEHIPIQIDRQGLEDLQCAIGEFLESSPNQSLN
jgi:hypothetical protein